MHPRDEFGAIGIASALLLGGKALIKAMPAFVSRMRDSALVARLRERRGVARGSLEQQLKREERLYRVSAGSARKRRRQRILELTEALELERLRSSLGEAGFDGSSPFEQGLVKELRRNQLAEEWDAATPARQVELEALIRQYDADLDALRAQVPPGSKAVYDQPRICMVRVTLGLLGAVALGGALMRSSQA